MSDHATADRRTTAEPSIAATPRRAEGPDRAQRLEAVPANHTFEPTPFGASSEATFGLPVNRGLEAAVVHLSVEGTGFRLHSMWAMKLMPAGQQHAGTEPDAPRVVYSPPGPGVHRGRLVTTSRWPDGHVERHVVELVGSSSTPDASVLGARPTPAVRLSSLQPRDLGEQVVGSSHTLDVTPPMNLGDTSAFAAVAIEGDAELSASWGKPGQVIDLNPGAYADPIKVAYAPLARGAHLARIKLVAHWPDRHVETQSVAITAQARELDDVPERERAPVTGAAQPAAANSASFDRDRLTTFGNTKDMDALEAAIASVFERQIAGVGVIEREQGTYKAPPVAKAMWMDLVELAIALGTAGMAHLLTSALVTHLAKSLGLGLKAVAPGATPAARISTEPDSDSLTAKVVKGVVGAVESSATTGAKARVQPSEDGDEPRYTLGNSVNPEIDFFSSQVDMLDDAKNATQASRTTICQQLLDLDSIRAGASAIGLAALTASLHSMRDAAKQVQMTHTAAQWLAYRTRASLGVERVQVDGREKTAAKLAPAREPTGGKLGSPVDAKGLLDVFADIAGGRVHVTGAKLRGVSWMVADRILDVNLRAEHVPIRIVLGNGSGYITRDELGRVRYSGLIHLDPDSDRTKALDEKQQLRTASLIVDHILVQSLRDWGIAAVETDDASTRPQQGGGMS